MAITFSNAFKEILNTLKEIIHNELKIPIHFDKDFEDRHNQYINILPLGFDVVSRFAGSSQREYSATLKYYLKKGNYEKHTHLDYLTSVGERLTRLFNDNTNPVSSNDLFKGVLSQFSESTGTMAQNIAYTFHDGRIDSIDYQPNLSEKEQLENLNVVELTFTAIVTEVYL
mgnify:CR=1 FL=1|tara:strand:+ start:1340 stop:1852 length:513 start_codon:yes stop_codon:yes gene_type:complete